MQSKLTRSLPFLCFILAEYVIVVYLLYFVQRGNPENWEQAAWQGIAIISIFLFNYFAQRFISLVYEPEISIENTTQTMGGEEYVKINNSSSYTHPEIKVYFEIYDTKVNMGAGVQSMFLIYSTSVSIGSILPGHGRSNPGTLFIRVPQDVMSNLVATRPGGTTGQMEVKVTSVHRLTNVRGLSGRMVTVQNVNPPSPVP